MAIAYDNSTTAYSNSTNSFTMAHTCSTGSDRILIVFVSTNSGVSSFTGATYGGTAMTMNAQWSTASGPFAMYFLIAPATGTNNVVIQFATTNSCLVVATSYTGVLQTVRAINNEKEELFGTRTSITATPLISYKNSWAVVMGQQLASPSASVTTTSGTERADLNYCWVADSNGPVTTSASNTITGTFSSASSAYCSFELVAAGETYKDLYNTPLYHDASLVAYYRLENTSDAHGGTYNLTNNGTVTFTTSVFDKGAFLGFSNTTKSLSIASDLGIAGGSCSIATWFKITTEPGTNLYSFLINLGDSSTNVQYIIWYNDTGGTKTLSANRQKQNVTNNLVTRTGTLGTSSWYHVVLTYDSGSSLLSFYVNGSPVGTPLTTSGNGASGVADNFTIGNDTAGNSWASAYYDDTAVFSRALTADEVDKLYFGKYPALTSPFPMFFQP
jgi:hypothetical protein